ncbi:hypothetical protein BU16DRAFT_559635 [Lophium mytilinum]|uniref:protein S-acyltransferase n=1 Tax=Lophium mytilinum TaxID=390894 RepID=A0A6A6R1U1_9PEZI|nr:hypothetical protein BU16DRAFT_559635 [Lophium mytilinum]
MTHDWDDVWEDIRYHYVVKRKPLKEVMALIEDVHGFVARQIGHLVHALVITYLTSDWRHWPSLLHQQVPSLTTTNSEERLDSEIKLAIAENEVARVQQILDSLPNARTALTGLSCLHRAVSADRSSIEMVKLLIDCGADLEYAEPKTRYTPLLQSVINGSALYVEALLDAGAKVNARTAWGDSSLHLAIRPSRYHSSLSIVRMLLNYKAEVDSKSWTQIMAVRKQQWTKHRKFANSVLEMFLKKDYLSIDPDTEDGFFVEYLDSWDSTVNWYRDVEEEEKSCLDLFISRGVRVNVSSKLSSCSISKSFSHDVLFHCPGSGLAELLAQKSYSRETGCCGRLLHALLEPCPNQVLAISDPAPANLMKIILNRTLAIPSAKKFFGGYTPLTRLLRGDSNLDVISCLDALLKKANPSLLDTSSRLPIFEAVRNFEDPLRLQITERLLSCHDSFLSFAEVCGLQGLLSSVVPRVIDHQWRSYTSESFERDVQHLPGDVQFDICKAIVSVSTKKAVQIYEDPAAFKETLSRFEILHIMKARHRFNLPPIQLPQAAIQMLLEQSLEADNRASLLYSIPRAPSTPAVLSGTMSHSPLHSLPY